ncbi:MAG TPA: hypothetical protein PKM48_03960 [Parvularculaceae bacterium]|nr:hypothetical protein [Parvularculaceae bacterium]HNS85334.1 hypothetical protein [Parvularculaceae bacterium]
MKSLLPWTALRLEARLSGVAGFTGSGGFRYALSPGGSADYAVEAKGVAGQKADLYACGEFVALLDCDAGRVSAKFDSRLGDPAIRLGAGDSVEIRQNGGVILAGKLAR